MYVEHITERYRKLASHVTVFKIVTFTTFTNGPDDFTKPTKVNYIAILRRFGNKIK